MFDWDVAIPIDSSSTGVRMQQLRKFSEQDSITVESVHTVMQYHPKAEHVHQSILGSTLGRGFYFSGQLHMSSVYSHYDLATGHRRLLMCRVLVGESTRGNQSFTECPPGYDSIEGALDTIVVFSNLSILPKYLVTFR